MLLRFSPRVNGSASITWVPLLVHAGFWVEVCHSFLISIKSFLGRSRSKTLMEEIVVEACSGCRKVCAT